MCVCVCRKWPCQVIHDCVRSVHVYVITGMEACALHAYMREECIVASDSRVTVMAEGGCNAANCHCLPADNLWNLPQLAFKVCLNHTYYVRQADCLCCTDLRGFTAMSKTQNGSQLDFNSANCPDLLTFFFLIFPSWHEMLFFLISCKSHFSFITVLQSHSLGFSDLFFSLKQGIKNLGFWGHLSSHKF